jgi:thymidylate synthase (FAD)
MEKTLMHAKLVSYSQPSEEVLKEGLHNVQDLIAFCDRVSTFEMTSACIEVETTRDIARQLLRHRSFSFQEFSQRYADPTEDLEFVTRDARLQDKTNRQNSIDIDSNDETHRRINENFRMKQKAFIRQSKELYNWAIEQGIAKEQARAVLPEGLTVSRLYVNGTLRSWIHFIELRSGNGTQKEHIELAREIACVITRIFPMAANYVH